MPRSRVTLPLLFAPLVLILSAGCARHTPPAVASPAPATAVAAVPPAAPPADFQPYTLLPPPPRAPAAVTHRHRVLHLTRVHGRVYLVDADRRLYEAGRDRRGHVYPVYRDPATRAAYPLYYDAARDNLYRVARADDGRFYRNYVGQPGGQFSQSDRDYERFPSSDADRPMVTDSGSTYDYNAPDDGSGGYDPGPSQPYPPDDAPAPSEGHADSNWLWAIPVVIGAYLVLHPRHHHPLPPTAPTTVIVINNTTVFGGRPVCSAPVFSGRPFYPSASAPFRRPVLRPVGLARVPPILPRGPVVDHRPIAPSAYAVPAARLIPASPPRFVDAVRPAPPLVPLRSRPVFRPRPITARPEEPTFFRRPIVIAERHVTRDAALPASARASRVPESPRPVASPYQPRPLPTPTPPAHVVAETHREASRPVPQVVHPVVIQPRTEPQAEVRREKPRPEPTPIAAPVSEPRREEPEPRRQEPEPRRQEPEPRREEPEPRRQEAEPRREEVRRVEPQQAQPREERKEQEKRDDKPKDTPEPRKR